MLLLPLSLLLLPEYMGPYVQSVQAQKSLKVGIYQHVLPNANIYGGDI